MLSASAIRRRSAPRSTRWRTPCLSAPAARWPTSARSPRSPSSPARPKSSRTTSSATSPSPLASRVSTWAGIAAVQAALAKLDLPPSIRVVYGGLYKTQQKSFRDLLLVLALAIVLVFLVLLFEFRNFSAPISILVSAVLSTAGVF